MKKIILAAIAVMAFSFAKAQETRFGVKGGLNLTTFVGGNVDDTNSLVGFHVGGFAEIKIIDKLAIQPELLFSTQGTKVDGGPFGDWDIKTNYLNIPVLAKYYIVEKFSVEAGPQLGVLLSAKSEGDDVKDNFKTVDLGFNLGAGYHFTENVSVNLRYTIGLSPLSDNADIENEGDYYDSAKNSVLALSFAYKF
ncbi:opacity protein-like surface antigen [Flavobacterium sp. HSC-32F16]|uniref:porin family protein n=1 Tax=Flavobacterium sp. HSC-32F16 TaxID=2910964 RepID=UPI0020A5CF1E|nr:porin family protein [Flavobacterium sp. HSC-32F16]MCP2029471.1 opacity protein-like surface antigen [Flavobacterium sp. HSC-32F16]